MTTMWRGVIIIPTRFCFVAHEKGLITIINVRSASLPLRTDFPAGLVNQTMYHVDTRPGKLAQLKHIMLFVMIIMCNRICRIAI